MLNQTGSFLALATPQASKPDGVQLPPIVIPDGKGPWALRYIWVKHKERNDEFVANYFNKGNNTTGAGLNLRKQTTHMQETAWNPHNKIFEESRDNGNLVWRVKVHNKFADSIDYVEVWRSREIIRDTFGIKVKNPDLLNPELPIKVSASPLARTPEEIAQLRKGLDEAGFLPRVWMTLPQVHPLLAMRWYMYFVGRRDRGEQCVINTPYNKELNPWRVWLPNSKNQNNDTPIIQEGI